MKKFTILMLMAAMAIPAMQAKVFTKDCVNVGKVRTTTHVATTPSIKPLKVTKVTKMRADVPAGYAQITLVADDVWGDGSGYQMLLDADATAYGTIIPTVGALAEGDADAAVYAEFEYKIPENADGALSTTNVIVSGSATIQIPAGTYDWCITNPTPGDVLYIAGDNGDAPARANDYEFVSGASYVFTMDLAGDGDGVFLTVDDPNAPAIPTNLTATPGATNAVIAWEAGANNATWNLRYRPYVEGTGDDFFEDFENFEGTGWYVIDADGDGNGWGVWDPTSYGFEADQTRMHGLICLTSASYNSSGALTPDNWLITPEVALNGTLSFWACGQDPSYAAEHFAVYAAAADWESTDDFVEIMPETVATGTITQYTVDLSSFNGEMGCIAFRHFNVTDMFRLNLDDVAITYAEGAEWTKVDGVENPYTIEGLTPETTYEVQVQGVGADERVTDWTESTIFTTLAEEQPLEIEELYLVGTFNGWNQTEEGGRIPFVLEDGVFTAANVDLEDGAEFKLITPAADGSWIWFGGVDDNNVGFFLINDDLLEQPIDLIDGANFRIENGGNFTIKVNEAPRGLYEPLKMTVVNNNPTAITDITTDSKDNTWYNIQGMKLQGVPTVPGIYINGGKKVVVK